jgi:phosphatidylserine/phosphatidylglycerophosphate/cardiolipin synthase-like enzyme
MRKDRDLQPAPVERASYPARHRNDVRVLIDGFEALGAIVARLRDARRSIWITVSFVELDVVLPGSDRPLLAELDAAAARGVDVRLLFWWSEYRGIGSFRGEAEELEELARRGVRAKMRWDEVPRGCHHQKSHVIDGEVAFVGGINLTADGVSTPAHDTHGHHDLFVELTGPAVADVAENFAQRWNQASRFSALRHAYPSADAADDIAVGDASAHERGDTAVQVVRTIRRELYRGRRGWSAEHAFDLSEGEHGIQETVHRWIDGAAASIYIENQYLMAPDTLERLRRAAARGVDVIAVVPHEPDPNLSLYPKAKLLETRAELDALAREERFGLFGLRHPGPSGRPIYVHAKLLVVDDRLLTIGSANFWPPSYNRDSELNVCIWSDAIAAETRRRLWREHVGDDGVRSLEDWRRIAKTGAAGSRIVPVDPASYYVFPDGFVAPWSNVKPDA